MTQLKGDLLADIWGDLQDDEKLQLSCDLGKVISEFHAVPVDGLTVIDAGWKDFLEQRLKNVYSHHQNAGLKSELSEKILDYVNPDVIEFSPAQALLTGEYTPFNLLMDEIGGKWKLTGVIDFADYFLGDPDYDLLGPILFMFCGDVKLIGLFLTSYGTFENGMASFLQQKLMTYTILHALE